VLFLCSPLTFEAAYRFRPEMMVAALGMLSYQCLDTGVRARKVPYMVLAGVMAGLAMSAHLNGVVYVVAGMVVIAGASRLPGLIAFAAGAGAGFLPYFYDMTSRADLSLWLVQFRHYPVMAQSNFGLLGLLLKPLHEVDRFVHKPPELVLSFLIVVVGFWSYRYLRARCRQLLLYTVCLMAGLAIFSSSRHPRYLMTYLPFLCILMGIGSEAIYTQVENVSTYVRRYLAPFAIGAYLLVSYATILGVVAHDRWDMLAPQRDLSARMRLGSRIVAPIAFTFATIEHHPVQGLEFYEMLKERGLIPAGTTPFGFAAESGGDYLIVDRGCVKRWHLADATSFGEYELVQRLPAGEGREEYWLFERRAAAIRPNANRR